MRQFKLQSLQKCKYPLPKPLKEYQTTLFWSGNVCFNPTEKSGRRIFSNLQMEEVEYPFHLSNIDSIEKIDYKLYSVEPLMWSENDDIFIEVIKNDSAENYRSLLENFVKPKFKNSS